MYIMLIVNCITIIYMYIYKIHRIKYILLNIIMQQNLRKWGKLNSGESNYRDRYIQIQGKIEFYCKPGIRRFYGYRNCETIKYVHCCHQTAIRKF